MESREEKTVKVVCPRHSYEAEEHGYAVVVSDSDRENPPKALCFVCGSAGIRQLIFCSGCCEPFHPYCSEDELLLSAFIAELSEENNREITGGGLLTIDSASRLNKFRRWRCYRCTVCKMCNTGSSDRSAVGTKNTTNSTLIKCGACLDSYHFSCARKVTSVGITKPSDISKWICHNCMKCTSCGIKLSKTLQQHYRKLSTESSKSNSEEREVLCLECFKQRKKGSYCPVCYVCYDDNDWDSKMMQCEKCNMWIHSRCEGLSDEKYSVLSSLPESIPYICRLCSPWECEVGWRQAVKNEIYDGFSKVLGFFQKKTVGMSRKRRALTFDEDNESFLTKDELSTGDKNVKTIDDKIQSIASQLITTSHCGSNDSNMCEALSTNLTEEDTNNSPNSTSTSIQNNCDTTKQIEENPDPDYSALFERYQIRDLRILLIDLDANNRKRKKRTSPRLSHQVMPVRGLSPSPSANTEQLHISSDNSSVCRDDRELPEPEEPHLELSEINTQTTPKKNPEGMASTSGSSVSRLLSFDFLTPSKLSTPARLVVSFTDAVRKATDLYPDNTSLCTITEFYRLCMSLIPTYFQEIDSMGTERYRDFFKDAMKQGFSWIDTSQLEDEIDMTSAATISLLKDTTTSQDDDELDETVKVEALGPEIKSNVSGIEESRKTYDQTVSRDCIMFEDLYWSLNNFMDYRPCSFCTEVGDFPTHLNGRLLYAGPEEWVHVNCALWSSEVWEEETGGLQQVDVALARGKRTKCNYCEHPGATLNCCAGKCKHFFHFLCAMRAGCFLMEDKTMFCPIHETYAKGSLQKDMHVTRKVFVDLDVSRKKDMKLSSSKITIYVGSLRVTGLGYVTPLSVHGCSSSCLVPILYTAERIFYSSFAKGSLELYTAKSSLSTEGDFRSYFDNLKDFEKQEEPFHITISHSRRNKKDYTKHLRQHTQFMEWMKIVPVYIDEHEVSWEMPCLPVVMQSYIKGTGLMTNGLKKFFKNKVHRSKIELNISVSEHYVSDDSSSSYEPTTLTIRPQENIYSFLTQNSSILSSPEEFPEEYFQFVNMMGLVHPAIQYITEQLPGIESVVGKYQFRHGRPHVAPEDVPVKILKSGSARAEGSHRRKPFDRFGWLASKHRKVPVPKLNFEETVKCKGLPIAMRFRNLKERSNKDLVVLSSDIHGRGLFARRDIEMGEMLIEYAGEVIRSSLCDMRERKYENEGMGCYMFRINRDFVVDATMKGNAARFINHSCDPNCESKCVKILGKDHILIFALKNIGRGEELTYDYKFDRESDKLPCTCNSKKCRKFLN